jgi:shikimate dehydrogenase
MHNPAMAALGLDWRYLAFEVHPDNLRQAIAGAKSMKFIGLNLTVPHKLLAMDLVDALDDSARTWGAVNTIRFETRNSQGEWQGCGQIDGEINGEIRTQGFNTDADAIIRSLKEDLALELRGASVLLLGAGGAGRVAALKLASAGVGKMFLVNRTASKAVAIAQEIRKAYPGVAVEVGYPKNQTVDLVLNATSLGLKPGDGSPLDVSSFPIRSARAVYDMIYRPAKTPLLQTAEAAGCRTANGLGMLLYQGAKALELWSGKVAPIEVMRDALKKNVYGAQL